MKIYSLSKFSKYTEGLPINMPMHRGVSSWNFQKKKGLIDQPKRAWCRGPRGRLTPFLTAD